MTMILLSLQNIFSWERLPLLICFVADACFIANPEYFRTPTIIFAIGHTFYAYNLFCNWLYVLYLIGLISIMIRYDNTKVLLGIYALILFSNMIHSMVDSHWHHIGGYWMFGVSDLLLYIRDFHRDFAYSNYMVLGLYFSGQYFLN